MFSARMLALGVALLVFVGTGDVSAQARVWIKSVLGY